MSPTSSRMISKSILVTPESAAAGQAPAAACAAGSAARWHRRPAPRANRAGPPPACGPAAANPTSARRPRPAARRRRLQAAVQRLLRQRLRRIRRWRCRQTGTSTRFTLEAEFARAILQDAIAARINFRADAIARKNGDGPRPLAHASAARRRSFGRLRCIPRSPGRCHGRSGRRPASALDVLVVISFFASASAITWR